MIGGLGNDTYYVDNAGDVVVETGNTASSQTAKDKKVNGSQNSYESPEATNLTTTLNVLAIP